MKSALRTSRIALAGLALALLAGCYGTGYVGVRHDSYGYRHGYSSYPYYGTRYYSYRPYYRPYGYRYYSGYGGPSLSLSYSRTSYRSPSYSYRTPTTYSYRTSSTAPSYSTTYVASSPTYTTTRSATTTTGAKVVHGKQQAHVKHKGNKHDR